MEREIPMRKFGLFAATALILVGFGEWIASNPQARVATPTNNGIDVLQMMTATGNFPTEHIVDYSLIFE
jgi:hypothetical protein